MGGDGIMPTDRNFFRVVLPWPDWDISPNGTKNREKRARLTKEHRYIAKMIARETIGFQNWVDADMLFSVWIFRQPDKKHRDTGNMRAAMKAYQDGIFDALLINDFAVKPELLFQDGIVQGGEVELRLYEDYRQWIDDVIVLTKEAFERKG